MKNLGFFLKNVATIVACFTVCLMLSGCEDEVNPTQFTVTFESNDGSEVPPQTVEEGKKAEKPDEPTRSGYTFDAWYKDEAFTNEWDFDVDVVTGDITLYAKWIIGGSSNDDVYLVTEISSVSEWGEVQTTTFEYDEQNRITKIIGIEAGDWTTTLEYNEAGELVKLIYGDEEDDNYVTFTRNSNIITAVIVLGLLNVEQSETLELNIEGLLVKQTREITYNNGNWEIDIWTYTYQGKNVIEYKNENEEFHQGELYYGKETFTFTYDEMKSPFFHCNTPQWFFAWNGMLGYIGENNQKTMIMESDSYTESYTVSVDYIYNDTGFPISGTSTVHYIWYDEEEEEEYEEVLKFTATFTYNNLQSSAPKNALRAAPNRSNVGSAPPNRNADRYRHPFSQRFGSRGQ